VPYIIISLLFSLCHDRDTWHTCLQRVANFSLDTALRDACASDLKNRCQHSLAEIDKDANVREAALNCLQTYKEELEGDQCRSEVGTSVCLLACPPWALAAGPHKRHAW